MPAASAHVPPILPISSQKNSLVLVYIFGQHFQILSYKLDKMTRDSARNGTITVEVLIKDEDGAKVNFEAVRTL